MVGAEGESLGAMLSKPILANHLSGCPTFTELEACHIFVFSPITIRSDDH